MPDRRAATETRLRHRHKVRTVSRPTASGTARFPLSYVRTGAGDNPILVLPGGPGLGSVMPYQVLLSWAGKQGLDLLMIEHRGIGLSRRTDDGEDLTAEDMRIRWVVEDIRQVLDAEGIRQLTVYGSSYGTYLAQAFAAEHPGRVDALVLDSPKRSAHDHNQLREHIRALLWHGEDPATAEVSGRLRALVAAGTVPQEEVDVVARVTYEFSGPQTLQRLVGLVEDGRGGFAWRRILALSAADTTRARPFLMEFDLVGVIAFRELNFAPVPDGLPFDPARRFGETARDFPSFSGEPYDLPAALADLAAPVIVLSGERDLRTPRPVAELIARDAADGQLIPVANTGHSILDTHPKALRRILQTISDRGATALPTLGDALDAPAGAPQLLSVANYLRLLLGLSPQVARLSRRRARVPGFSLPSGP